MSHFQDSLDGVFEVFLLNVTALDSNSLRLFLIVEMKFMINPVFSNNGV